MAKTKYDKVTNQESAYKLVGGTSLKDRIGWNYKQLVILSANRRSLMKVVTVSSKRMGVYS